MSNSQDNSLSLASLVISNLLDDDLVVLNGFGSKENHLTRIVITSRGAGSEYIESDGRIKGTNIPALNVYEWNEDNLKHLESWLASTLHDDNVKKSRSVEISARNWKK